jgi:pimeloyl-ACP methyl ester carboxylesterase
MKKVLSKDGTAIVFETSGEGTPLILVHGTGGTRERWAPVVPMLEKQFTVYTMDRRGRGESHDDGVPYAIEREFEDVAALVDSVGGPVDLFGHSYGGICALEASVLTSHIRRLVLYEPPIPPAGFHVYPPGIIERLQGLLDAGDREGVLVTFMTELVRMPKDELKLTLSMPAWPSRIAAAHTLPRELRAHEQYRFVAERFRAMTTPTLLLIGGDSPEHVKTSTLTLNAAFPESRIVILPGQQHVAMETAPDLLAREVLKFLTEQGR